MDTDELIGRIYLVTNTINGKVYVGQTTCSLKRRWAGHVREATRGSQSPIHRAIRKYGATSFSIELLQDCSSIEHMDRQERSWIAQKKSTSSHIGYNATFGGDRGFIFTSETRARISQGVLAAYERQPELKALLSALAVAQFAKPGAREAIAKRSSEMMKDPDRRARLSEAASQAIQQRPDLIRNLNEYNRSEAGRRKHSENRKRYHLENPGAREEMSARARELYQSDPITRERSLAALQKARAASVAKRGAWASLEVITVFAEGRTVHEYNRDRAPHMPCSTVLPRVFGLTYGEIKHGHRGRVYK